MRKKVRLVITLLLIYLITTATFNWLQERPILTFEDFGKAAITLLAIVSGLWIYNLLGKDSD